MNKIKTYLTQKEILNKKGIKENKSKTNCMILKIIIEAKTKVLNILNNNQKCTLN